MYMYIRKSDCLGCAVLLCLVCLFDLACFILSSFSSLIKTCIHVHAHTMYIYQGFRSRSPLSPLARTQIIWRLLGASKSHSWPSRISRVYDGARAAGTRVMYTYNIIIQVDRNQWRRVLVVADRL